MKRGWVDKRVRGIQKRYSKWNAHSVFIYIEVTLCIRNNFDVDALESEDAEINWSAHEEASTDFREDVGINVDVATAVAETVPVPAVWAEIEIATTEATLPALCTHDIWDRNE